jgi:hypothetical protein
LGASLATTGAGADEADESPPKLKKEAMFCPSTALAKSFGQYEATLTPAAERRVAIFYPIYYFINYQ